MISEAIENLQQCLVSINHRLPSIRFSKEIAPSFGTVIATSRDRRDISSFRKLSLLTARQPNAR